MQGLLFDIPSSWVPPKELPNLHGDWSLDLETRDPLMKTRGPGWAWPQFDPEIRGQPVGFGVSTGDESWYLPFGHLMGGNLERENVYAWMKDMLERPGKRVFHNAMYDCGWMEAEGFEIDYSVVEDTQYMAALINENERRYNLDACLERFLGERKDETMLRQAAKAHKLDPKSDMWQLHSKHVGGYGEQDAGGTMRLWRRLQQDMNEQDLHRVYNLERSILPIVIKMRQRGTPISLDRAEEVKQHFQHKELEAIGEIHNLTGLRVRPGIPSKDAAALLRHIGVPVPKTTRGADSVVASYLETIDHPIGKLVVKSRQFQKAWKDFIDGQIFSMQVNGRIHASFHPMMSDEGGTVTGRFSCSNPNLQQVPARNPEIGPYIRSCYVGEEGEQLAPLDYSSQEPRWTVHFATAMGFRGAAQAAKAYQDDPRMDYHEMMASICFPEAAVAGGKNKKRRAAKDIFLGICYGMGGGKLCRTLGLPTELWYPNGPEGDAVEVAGAAGKEIMQQFNGRAPFVKELQQKAEQLSRGRGYVKTIFGRRGRTEDHRKALNKIIQGSSADQTKASMLEVKLRLKKIPLMQVHDEIVYSVSSQEEANKIARVMETAIPGLHVPFVVDCEIVPNWGAVKK